MIRGYVIHASHEQHRQQNVNELLRQLPELRIVPAIYPSLQKVPFAKVILSKARNRRGRPFMQGELGVLLSNRRIWREIQHHPNEEDHFLIVESDSHLNEVALLRQEFDRLTKDYDLFFWGAWLGHMVLQRSTRQQLSGKYVTGVPFLRSVSGAYGYSLNKKAAIHLLAKTGKLLYPVDEFKRYIDPAYLRVGGVTPELISQGPGESMIDAGNKAGRINKAWIKLLTIRNKIIAHFS